MKSLLSTLFMACMASTLAAQQPPSNDPPKITVTGESLVYGRSSGMSQNVIQDTRGTGGEEPQGMALLLITSRAIANEPSPVSKSTPGRATATQPADDPFVGDYIGDIHPLGVYEGKQRPKDDKDFKPTKCGTCHRRPKSSAAVLATVHHARRSRQGQGREVQEGPDYPQDRAPRQAPYFQGRRLLDHDDGRRDDERWVKQMAAEIKLSARRSHRRLRKPSESCFSATALRCMGHRRNRMA